MRSRTWVRHVVLAGLLLGAGTAWAQAPPVALIPPGDTWKYNDKGTNLGTAWRAVAYNDSGWSSGPAQLGYGDGDEATVISYGSDPSNRRPCYYFRRAFTVASPSAYASLTLRVLRDDGCVVYLNGQEVARSNMPSGTISYGTWASTAVSGLGETAWYEFYPDPALLVSGTNVVAVEVHQSSGSSSDVSFDLELLGGVVDIIKDPYLQRVTQSSIVVMWETNGPAGSRVDFGKAAPSELSAQDPTPVRIHEITLTGLDPATTYQYTVTSGSVTGAAGTFTTAPPATQGFRFAAYGDSRGAQADHSLNAAHLAVANALIASHPALVLHTGDLAYEGSDLAAWWAQFFGPAADLIRNTPLFPSPGNHEYSLDSTAATYRGYFSLPSAGERWYSFDYGSAHFICLDTNVVADYSPGSAQYDWLVQDLAAASLTTRWIFVSFHHPPYTSGSKHSDNTNVQTYLVPLFELYGVHVVFNGHTHAYERYFSNGVYYIVTGGGGADLHTLLADTVAPIRQVGASVYHHCVIDVSPGAVLFEARDNSGAAFDAFSLTKDITPPVLSAVAASAITRTSATITWTTDEPADSLVAYGPTPSYGSQAADPALAESHSVSLTGLTAGTTYHYRVTSKDAAGNAASSSDLTFATAPPNQPPVAKDDSATTLSGTPVTLDVLANDSDLDKDPLTITSVTDPPHGTAAIQGSQVTYTSDPGYGGQDTFQYTISDGQGGAAAATVTVTVNLPGPSVTYVTTDSSRQGDWKGVYGIEGYRVVQDSTKYPAYATVGEPASQWTWASSPTEARALQRAASGRIAACWFAASSMAFDVDLTDGKTHRMALYFLDWDTSSRTEVVEFRDPSNNALLDTRTVTAFNAGKYLVWDVRGHVRIVVTRTAGANTVLSGLFFGVAPPDTTPPTAPASLAAATAGKMLDLTWTAASDPESGISAYKVYRGTAPGGETFLKQVANVTTYADSDTAYDTTYYYKVSAVNGAALEGPQSDEASAKTGPPPAGASAVFVTTDATTQGDWKGAYGTEGYRVVQDSTKYPAYATVAEPPNQWPWSTSTTEKRALQREVSGRIAACWYAASSMAFDVDLTDGKTHRMALYFLDWDTTSRAATVEFRDAVTSALLDTRSVTAFSVGKYLVWDVAGHVRIAITQSAGANAVISGLFFGAGVPDTTPPTAPASLAAAAAGKMLNLTWTAASDPESGIGAYKVYRGTAPGSETFLKQIANVTSYSDSDTAYDTTYYYKVAAVNGAALEGPQSNEASAKTGPPPQGASAVFVKEDAGTQGDWKGTYGTEGYRIVQDSTKYPAYATVAEPPNQWPWSTSTAEKRALQREVSGRIAACWFAVGSSMAVDVDLTDGKVHRMALYFLDWDTTSRAATVEFRDAVTNTLLDTRSVTAFSAGKYLVWDVAGHVRIGITKTGGANAVVSGLFFGAAAPAPPPTADGPTILLVPDRGPAPLEVQAMAVGIEPGTPVTWDFGDGSTPHQGLGIENTHTYFSPGLYTVTLHAGGKTAHATVRVGETSPR